MAHRSPGAAPPAVRCRHLTRLYGPIAAVDDLELDVAVGEVLAVLGPSGCGKTTLLRLVAGFERPDVGSVEVGGEIVAAAGVFVPPERRHVGIVVQDHALFPHLTVARNVAFGLEGRRQDSGHRARVQEVLDLVGLTGLDERFPSELSGGQQQRVAIARALAPRPSVILLDEPFANLDAALRFRIRAEVREILRAAGATGILVTHDQEEALSLADRVAVMDEGRVVQVGTPQEVYARPSHPFVARFVGGAELLPGTCADGVITTAAGRLEVTGDHPCAGPAIAVIRPEVVALDPPGTAGGIPATVVAVAFFGHDQLVEVRLGDGTVLRSRRDAARLLHPGDQVTVRVGGRVAAFATGV